MHWLKSDVRNTAAGLAGRSAAALSEMQRCIITDQRLVDAASVTTAERTIIPDTSGAIIYWYTCGQRCDDGCCRAQRSSSAPTLRRPLTLRCCAGYPGLVRHVSLALQNGIHGHHRADVLLRWVWCLSTPQLPLLLQQQPHYGLPDQVPLLLLSGWWLPLLLPAALLPAVRPAVGNRCCWHARSCHVSTCRGCSRGPTLLNFFSPGWGDGAVRRLVSRTDARGARR
jgi:hypothetical protein